MVKWFRETWRRMQHITFIRFVTSVFTRFGKDNGALLAAGLAFFLVIAFVPMLLTGIAVLGYYFHLTHNTHNAVDEIKTLLMTQILPGAAGREVQHLMLRADVAGKVQHITATRGISGLIGILGLIWASIQIYLNGAVAMNAAWEVSEKRNWFMLRLIAFGLFLVAGVFLVLSIASTAYGTWLSHSSVAHYVPGWAIMVEIGTELAAVAGAAVMYAVTYKYLPAAPVSWRSAFVGGITSAILWEIAKKGLAVYLLHPNVSLYGNLANLIIFILWVYYSMTIFLLGTEVSVVYTHEVEERRRALLRRTAKLTPAIDPSLPTTTDKGRLHGRKIRPSST
jgi:membrane protein